MNSVLWIHPHSVDSVERLHVVCSIECSVKINGMAAHFVERDGFSTGAGIGDEDRIPGRCAEVIDHLFSVEFEILVLVFRHVAVNEAGVEIQKGPFKGSDVVHKGGPNQNLFLLLDQLPRQSHGKVNLHGSLIFVIVLNQLVDGEPGSTEWRNLKLRGVLREERWI